MTLKDGPRSVSTQYATREESEEIAPGGMRLSQSGNNA